MSQPETLPAPVIDRPPRHKWEREYRAFLRLLPELLKTHRGKYVAVHEEQVVDSGDDEVALTKAFASPTTMPRASGPHAAERAGGDHRHPPAPNPRICLTRSRRCRLLTLTLAPAGAGRFL